MASSNIRTPATTTDLTITTKNNSNKQNISIQSTTIEYDQSTIFDIFDYENRNNDNNNTLTDKSTWVELQEDFNCIYPLDNNTLSNIIGDAEEQEYMEKYLNMSPSGNLEGDEKIVDDKDEQILSQRLSQLSTLSDYEYEITMDHKRRRLPLPPTTSIVSQSITKRFRTSMEEDTKDKGNDNLPDYLLSRNKLFDQMIYKNVDKNNMNDTILEDIRQMACFMYQIRYFNILHDLWSTYLRSGTGLLADNDDAIVRVDEKEIYVDRRYWPHCITSMREISNKQQLKETSTSTASSMEKSEQIIYQTIACDHIKKYGDAIEYYQKQFNENKQQLIHSDSSYWTEKLEKTLEIFIEQHDLKLFRIKCESRQNVLMYQYKNELIERKIEQFKLTNEQKQLIKNFFDKELQLEIAKSELNEYRQRIICNKPPTSYNSLQIKLPWSFYTLSNKQLREQFFNQYENLIQQTKTDLIMVYLKAKQAIIYQYQSIVDEQRKEINENKQQQISESLKQLIHQHSLNMYEHIKFIYHFIINYSIRNSISNNNLKICQPIGFLTNLLIDSNSNVNLLHKLTNQQLQLLRRGPTYVAPCQLRISSTFENIKDMLGKQYAPLKHQIALVFDTFHTEISTKLKFDDDIFQQYKNLFSIPLPNNIYQRALYEKQLIQSIHHSLNSNNLLLRRTSDQNNMFYLTNRADFIHRCNQYVENHTDHFYYMLYDIKEINNTDQNIQEKLNKKYSLINIELQKLFNEKKIGNETLKKLRIKIGKVKLPYLYFLPDLSTKNSFQIKPMFSTLNSVTANLAQYLKQLIRPLFYYYTTRTMFLNEIDFMEKFYTHTTDDIHHLQSSTIFTTIKIMNFDTMVSHETLVEALLNFLNNTLPSNKIFYTTIKTLKKRQSISIDTIKKLIELYLENNIFYYNEKIYGFKRSSGPNSFLLSELLSNIYLSITYDKFIFDDTRMKTQFYGRYKNQLFFTWNQSRDELIQFLDIIKEKYSHIQIETSIGKDINFLNVHLDNRHNHFYTNIFHGLSRSKYVLPYVTNHTTLNHRLWLRSALIRAICFSSDFHDFKQEEINLEIAYLLNGYSIDFIEQEFKDFYFYFKAEKIRFALDQATYKQLRQQLFDFIKIQQRTLWNKNHDLEDQEFIFHFSYSYDYGSYKQFNLKFRNLWTSYLKHDAQLGHENTKIILNSKHLYSLNTLLAEQKPSMQHDQLLSS